tara:strand:+ start:11998 stop:12501 length:504 start_codon:yes stop_codon:yes gene_type:complete
MEITHTQLKKLKQQREVNRYEYLGMLSDYQTVKSKLVQDIVYTQLNTQQIFLFKRVLHGLNAYKSDELVGMHWDKKRRVKKVWRKAQRVINRFKQTIANKRSNEILSMFDHSPLAKNIMSVPVEEVDDQFINKMTLKELGIKYEDLIIKFYSEGLLPRNYFQLKENV